MTYPLAPVIITIQGDPLQRFWSVNRAVEYLALVSEGGTPHLLHSGRCNLDNAGPCSCIPTGVHVPISHRKESWQIDGPE